MWRQKQGLTQVTAEVPREGTVTSKGTRAGSWRKKSNTFQKVPSNVGYLETIEESTWSKNHDSAASMFPPGLDLWEENFQDLSDYCHKQQLDMSTVMVGDTKSSNGTVQDDELNTPDLGIQRVFNFTSSASLSNEDTSPCLFDGEGWAIPPIDLPEVSLEDKFQSSRKGEIENPQSRTTDGCFVEDAWTLSHEEEIASSQNHEGKYLKEPVQNKMGTDLNNSINVYNLGVQNGVRSIDFDNHGSVDIIIPTSTDFKSQSLEALLGTTFSTQTLSDKNSSVNTIKQEGNTRISLESLLADSVFEVNSGDGCRSVDIIEDNVVSINVTSSSIPAKSRVLKNSNGSVHLLLQENAPEDTKGDIKTNATNEPTNTIKAEEMVKESENNSNSNCISEMIMTIEMAATNLTSLNSESLSGIPNLNGSTNNGGAVELVLSNNEDFNPKKNLMLNLPTLFNAEDISTPVVLEPFLKRDGTFDLLDYVFSTNPSLHLDSPDVKADHILPMNTVTLSNKIPEVTAIKTEEESNDVVLDTAEDEAIGVIVVDPVKQVVLDKYLDVGLNMDIAHTDEDEDEEEEEEDSKLLLSINKVLRRNEEHLGRKGKSLGKRKLKGNKFRKSGKVWYKHRDLQEETELQEGQSLKLKITKSKLSVGQFSSTLVSQKEASRKNLQEQNEEPSPKQRGRPPKRKLTTTFKEESTEPQTPQPKLSRLSSVESECDKYRELRDKNNEASRKSRQNRKAKEQDMKEIAKRLEKENQSLKIKADEMERLVKKLRESLLEAVVKNKKE